MKTIFKSFLICLVSVNLIAQDLSNGYVANDIELHLIQEMAKPTYLSASVDDSFPSTLIRRISEANPGNFMSQCIAQSNPGMQMKLG